MNRKHYTLIALCALALGWTGCSEYEMDRYQNSPAIYFNQRSSGDTPDSTNHSFFLLPSSVEEDTVWLRVNAMGLTEAVDRPIVLVQTNKDSANAAKAGVHYKPFDTPGIVERLKVPAGATYGRVPIVIIRDASLELQEKRLALALVSNEHFRLGINTWRTHVVITTAQAVKPLTWDRSGTNWAATFGASFGSRKFRFIIDATGYTDWERIPSDPGMIFWMKDRVKEAWDAYNSNSENEPLEEADGKLVVFETF